MENEVTMTIPRPLYCVDAELDLASCLQRVLNEFYDVVTPAEQERALRWFAERNLRDRQEELCHPKP